ncbi:hypothetical protein [Vibrio scophthalmi]|uniref:Uncharacterized protein n=1 Tax=Vibrio scophthalmi LMG 19158 TaxID=870967 RepID=F9RIB9_9VIBR|nr:hypothetical protein [Vibrio scophthalmi]EGU42451.1 hypothetical protein VIS19158_11658 [Vibrio scophthalmi LMG 19158]
MASFQIIFKDVEENELSKEVVFMKGLPAAKCSAKATAPANAYKIEITDLMGKELTRITLGQSSKWHDAI